MKSYKFYIFSTILFLFLNLFPSAMASTQQIRLIIFPFQNLTQNKADDWIGNGFAETLTTSLTSVKSLVLLERSQLKNMLTEQMFAQTAYVDQKSAIEFGKVLSANIAVIGNFQKVNNMIRVNARFVDVATGEIQKDHVADIQGKLDDIFTLQNQLADKIIKSFSLTISQEESQKVSSNIHSTNSIEAYENFIKGKEILAQIDTINSCNRAIEFLEKAIKIDPSYAVAHAYLSIAYAYLFEINLEINKNLDSYKLKISEYANQAIKLSPDLPEAHRAMACYYIVVKDNDKAEDEIKIALKLNPNDIDSILLYITRIGKKDIDERLNELEKYIGNYSDNITLLLSISSIYFQKIQQIKLGNNKSNVKEIEIENESIKKIISYMDMVIKKAPDNFTAHVILANVYIMLNKNDLVDYHLKEILRIEPNSFLSYYQAGQIYYNQERWNEAETALKKSLDLEPNSYAYIMLGFIYSSQKRHNDVISISREAIKYNPDNSVVYIPMANAYMALNRYEECESVLKEALKRLPDSAWLHGSLAGVYDKQNKQDEAIKEYYMTIAGMQKEEENIGNIGLYNSQKSNIYSAISDYYVKQNKIDSAISDLIKAIEIYPQNARAYQSLADLYMLKKEYDKALANLEKLTELKPEDEIGFYNLGNACLRFNQFEKAETALKKSIELKPDYVKAHYNLGVVYWQLGKYKEAADSWETTLKLDPANQNSKEWLQKAKDKIK